jgi:hypothetical protein
MYVNVEQRLGNMATVGWERLFEAGWWGRRWLLVQP